MVENPDNADEIDIESDPEIQECIWNWLAYEIATKHSTSIDAMTGKAYTKDIRRKRRRGELCLRCNAVPKQNYTTEERFSEKGFCETCMSILLEAGEYCFKCHYAFDKHYMHSNDVCKFCDTCPDAPRLSD